MAAPMVPGPAQGLGACDLPDPAARPVGPIFVRHGTAQVSYEPGHDMAEVEFTVGGWRTPCTAEEARQLARAIDAALGHPLAATMVAAHNAATLGERGAR